MSNFTPLVTKSYTFEGDNVTVTFARVKRKHMMKLLPKVQQMKNLDEDSEERQTAIVEVLNDIAEIVPEYVHDFKGLTDSQGQQISIEVALQETYFMQLALDICMDVVNESVIGIGPETKNG